MRFYLMGIVSLQTLSSQKDKDMENVLVAHVTKEKHVDAYLRIWNGGLQLTDRELEVVKKLISSYQEFEGAGVQEPYLTEMLFSQKNIRKIKDDLNLSKQNWGNIKKRLKEKKVLIDGKEEDVIYFNTMLLPKEEITFKFNIKDE